MSMRFIDLAAQQARLKESISARIATVLDHGQYVLGPEVTELEQALAAFTGAAACVTCANGTDALTIAMMGAGIGPGDAVFVPTFTFTATAESVLLLGATPVFCDVEVDSFNLNPASLKEQIERVITTGILQPKMIMPVDLFGLPADYVSIQALADCYDLKILADSAQAFGASQHGVKVGSLSEMSATSFFPAKPLGCYGDGGALFTMDAEQAELWRSIRMHGEGQSRYDIIRLGMNSRLDTLQAAILLVKLDVLEQEILWRTQAADRYDWLLADHVHIPIRVPDKQSAWAQYTVRVTNRDAVAAAMQMVGIPTAIYYSVPMHLQPAYAAYGQGAGSLPVSESLAYEVLSLPMYPDLTQSLQDRVATALINAVRAHAA